MICIILHVASYEGEFNNCKLSIKSNNGALFFLLSIDIKPLSWDLRSSHHLLKNHML